MHRSLQIGLSVRATDADQGLPDMLWVSNPLDFKHHMYEGGGVFSFSFFFANFVDLCQPLS